MIHRSDFSCSSPPAQADTHRLARPPPLLHHVMGVQVYQVPAGGVPALSTKRSNVVSWTSSLLLLLLLSIGHMLHERDQKLGGHWGLGEGGL